MHSFSQVLFRSLQGLIKLGLMVFVAALLLGLLLVGMLVALSLVLWSLLRGRRPALFSAFSFFRQASSQLREGAWANSHRADTSEVVDVQAHEVRAVLTGGADPKGPGH
jgi:hypothetical protein